jgi:hypothetical protein
MSGPGAGDYTKPPLPTEELKEGEIPTPAEQQELDLRDTLDEASTLEKACYELRNSDDAPDSKLASCSCYEGALALVRSDLAKWAEYNRKNEAYNNYLDDKAAWDQRFREKREEYSKIRGYANCGACGTQQNCNKRALQGNWENTGTRTTCNAFGCKSQCKYSKKGLDSLMESWTVTYPPPDEPQDPPIPEGIQSAKFQCCVNEISGDITLEEASSILQSCSQTIADDLDLSSADKKKVDEEEGQRREEGINLKEAIDTREGGLNTILIIILSVVGGILFALLVGLGGWWYHSKKKKRGADPKV